MFVDIGMDGEQLFLESELAVHDNFRRHVDSYRTLSLLSLPLSDLGGEAGLDRLHTTSAATRVASDEVKAVFAL